MNRKKTYTIDSAATTTTTCSTQFTVTKKQAQAPKQPAHGKDPVALELVAACVHRVSHVGLARFVASYLHEPEILEVMTRAMGMEGTVRHSLGDCIDKAARRMRAAGAHLGQTATDAIYAAALLVGIAAECDSTNYPAGPADLVRSITCIALHRLDDSDALASSRLRELMGWGNDDEADEAVSIGFRVRVLSLLDQEKSIQAIRTQALLPQWGAMAHAMQHAAQGTSLH